MSLETLQIVWFSLLAVLWVGYFVLEGFDYGVGVLLPVVGKNEAERRTVITTLGPLWDGNEVWLVAAGGATFAAFPEWYATMFSGFYLPLLTILFALIIRGVAFEYRSKRSDLQWRKRWDVAIVVGSLLPAVLWGVTFGNILRGVELVENPAGGVVYVGSVLDLLNPYALLAGLTTLLLFLVHGAIFLALKTHGTIRERANRLAGQLGLVTAVVAVAFLLWSQLAFSNAAWTWVLVVVAAGSFLGSLAANRIGREGWAFAGSAVAIGSAVGGLFGMLYPNVLPNVDRALPGLTVANASASELTLQIMTVVAIILMPVVMAYQAYNYWVFRKRLSPDDIPNPHAGLLDYPHEAEAARARQAQG
jgi:cytochrome d ubiquinol oxidase subunit II